MPNSHHPEITLFKDGNGVVWRTVANPMGDAAFGYVETRHNRAHGDESLRRLHWNASEMHRLKSLAGME